MSYPQRGGLRHWVAQVLRPLLEEKLDEAGIDEAPQIFVDTQAIKPGTDWPDRLADAHARSRVIVPLLCAPYFLSGWCTSEWTNAFEREERERQRTGAPLSLVLPLRFNDLSDDDVDNLKSPSVRDQVRARKRVDVSAFTCLINPKAENNDAYLFRQEIERFCGEVLLPAIKVAPPWQPDWPRLPRKPISGRDPLWAAGM